MEIANRLVCANVLKRDALLISIRFFVRRAAIGRAAAGAVQSAATLHLCFSHPQSKNRKKCRNTSKAFTNRYIIVMSRHTLTHRHTHAHRHTSTQLKLQASLKKSVRIVEASLRIAIEMGIEMKLGLVAVLWLPRGCTLSFSFSLFNWKTNYFWKRTLLKKLQATF